MTPGPNHRYLGIIPARGGSKGIPGKNLQPLAGKPLIHHTIHAAQASRLARSFLVSTDDAAIAAAAAQAGAPVPFLRPADLATDEAGTLAVVQHALAEHEAVHGRVDAIVLLQPTAPLRRAEDIDAALAQYEAVGADSLISVYDAGPVHPAIMYRREGERLVPLVPEMLGKRRQEFPPVYVRNGVLYIVARELLMRGALVGANPAFYLMPRERSLNIDAPEDLAEAAWRVGHIDIQGGGHG